MKEEAVESSDPDDYNSDCSDKRVKNAIRRYELHQQHNENLKKVYKLQRMDSINGQQFTALSK